MSEYITGAPTTPTLGGIALLLLGYHPVSTLADGLLSDRSKDPPSHVEWRRSQERRAMAMFAAQTAVNTLVFGWGIKKVFGTPGVPAYAAGFGTSIALSTGLFAYAYQKRKEIDAHPAKDPSQVAPPPKVGALVSPEF